MSQHVSAPGEEVFLADIVLITGGNRSGKSDYAKKTAEEIPGPRAFVATCPPIDEEMVERIRRHQEARDKTKWHTIEEPVNLAEVLANSTDFNVVLVDCLTLWVNNLTFEALREKRALTEKDMERKCREVLAACTGRRGTVFFVTNEIGMGVIPGTPESRLFCDLLGRCNQIVAGASHQVIMMACGLPLKLKDEI